MKKGGRRESHIAGRSEETLIAESKRVKVDERL